MRARSVARSRPSHNKDDRLLVGRYDCFIALSSDNDDRNIDATERLAQGSDPEVDFVFRAVSLQLCQDFLEPRVRVGFAQSKLDSVSGPNGLVKLELNLQKALLALGTFDPFDSSDNLARDVFATFTLLGDPW